MDIGMFVVVLFPVEVYGIFFNSEAHPMSYLVGRE
jgi:hypothetical protein